MKKVLGVLSLSLLILPVVSFPCVVGSGAADMDTFTVKRSVNQLLMKVLGGRYPGGVEVHYGGTSLFVTHSTGGVAIALSRSQIAALAEGRSEDGRSLGVKRFVERDYVIFIVRDLIFYADDGRLWGEGGEVHNENFSGNGFFDAFPRYENRTFSMSERILERHHLSGPWQMEVVRGVGYVVVNLTSPLLTMSFVLRIQPGGNGESVYPRFVVTLGREGTKRVRSVRYTGMVVRDVRVNRASLTVQIHLKRGVIFNGGNLTLLTEFYALRYTDRRVVVGFYRYTPQRSPPGIVTEPPVERYGARELSAVRNMMFRDGYTPIANNTFESRIRVYPVRALKIRFGRGLLYGLEFWAGMSDGWNFTIVMESPTEVNEVEARTPIVEHGSAQVQTVLILLLSALIVGGGVLLLLKKRRRTEGGGLSSPYFQTGDLPRHFPPGPRHPRPPHQPGAARFVGQVRKPPRIQSG